MLTMMYIYSRTRKRYDEGSNIRVNNCVEKERIRVFHSMSRIPSFEGGRV